MNTHHYTPLQTSYYMHAHTHKQYIHRSNPRTQDTTRKCKLTNTIKCHIPSLLPRFRTNKYCNNPLKVRISKHVSLSQGLFLSEPWPNTLSQPAQLGTAPPTQTTSLPGWKCVYCICTTTLHWLPHSPQPNKKSTAGHAATVCEHCVNSHRSSVWACVLVCILLCVATWRGGGWTKKLVLTRERSNFTGLTKGRGGSCGVLWQTHSQSLYVNFLWSITRQNFMETFSGCLDRDICNMAALKTYETHVSLLLTHAAERECVCSRD